MTLTPEEQRVVVARLENVLRPYDANQRLSILLAAVYGNGVIALKMPVESLVMLCVRMFDAHAGVIDSSTLERLRKLAEDGK